MNPEVGYDSTHLQRTSPALRFTPSFDSPGSSHFARNRCSARLGLGSGNTRNSQSKKLVPLEPDCFSLVCFHRVFPRFFVIPQRTGAQV